MPSSTRGSESERRARTGRARARPAGIGLALALALASGSAAADPTSDAATAEVLFRDGKDLMRRGKIAAACAKLDESQRLDPSTGTLLALGLCHEREGRTATAWAELLAVVPAARRDGRADRESVAREHAAALERSLSFLTIQIAPELARIADLRVSRDGAAIGQASLGVAVPVDPGPHRVDASAGGRRAVFAVDVKPNGDRQTVTIARLEDAPPTPRPPPAAETGASSGASQRVVAIGVGAGAVVAIGVGAFFGVRAIQKSNDAKAACDPRACTNAGAIPLHDDARRAAVVADVALGVGAIGLGAAAILFFTAPVEATFDGRSARVSWTRSW